MASLIDRLTERLGEIIDDVRLPAHVSRALDDAEAALASGDAAACLAHVRAVDAERPNVWRARVLAGFAHEALGDLDRAAVELTAAVQAREDTLVRVALGRIATQLGALRSAREHFDVALRRRPDDAERLDILRAAAALDERLGPPGRAVPTLRQALRIAPNDPNLIERLARALREEGDLDAAITAIAPALEFEPPPLAALLLAGALRLERGTSGDRTSARLGYERILERSPDNPDALEGLANVLRVEGQVAEALPLLRHALTTAPVSAHARLHAAVGACYAATAAHEDALDALRAAAALAVDDVEIGTNYARAALRAGRHGEALQAAEAAHALDADHRLARATLGRAQLATGDNDAAQRTLSPLRAARMEPEVLRVLGELALATGDGVEAIALLREAALGLAADPTLTPLIERAVRDLAPDLPELPPLADLAPPQLAPFLDALGEAVARHPLLTDLIPRTTALRQHLDTPLTIAVLGEFNAGKSTLINAFLAEDVVATGVLPTTSHVNVVRYGPRKVARWTRHDGVVDEIPYAEARRLTKKEPEAIAALEFCYPHPELRSVHFWDTPGFNAPDSAHEARAREALRAADAVVWMLDANQALSSTEFDRLEAIPNRHEKLLVVINKADRLGDDPEARAAVEDHVRSHMGGAMAGLFWLSALQALKARTPEAEARLPDGGWAGFADALQASVFERAGRLKSLEVATGLAALTTEVLERATIAARTVSSARAGIGETRVKLETRRSRWGAEVGAAARSELNRGLQDLRAQVASEVAQLAAPGPGLFGRRELSDDDRGPVRERVIDRTRVVHADVVGRISDAASAIDTELITLVESTATAIGPPESRTLRRRLEGYLAETAALRETLRGRLIEAPTSVSDALTRALGDAVLDLVASQRPDAERDAALQRILRPVGAPYVAEVERWGDAYLRAALRLCDHVERDLDILALDLEHRIEVPFAAVADALGMARAADAAATTDADADPSADDAWLDDQE